MFQVYFLTVITNILAGLAVATPFLKEKIKGYDQFSGFMEHRAYKVWLGAATVVVGVLTLFKYYETDIVILGDLLPALSGLFTGSILVLQFFIEGKDTIENSEDGSFISRFHAFSLKYGAVIGIAAIVIGILHLVIPTALFL